jgi:hypothetical protein
MPEQEFDNSGFGNNNFFSQKNQEFSHESLVMIAMRKVLEFSCGELIHGYYETQTDDKGKTKIVYKQDTMKAFIESVRSLRMVMLCDFDDVAIKNLIASKKGNEKPETNLIDKLKERKEFWISQQEYWWSKLSDGMKKSYIEKGEHVIDGYLNVNLPFYNQYFMEELEIYREIFEELTLLTKRIKFYKKIPFNVDMDDFKDDEDEIVEVN